MAYSYNDNTSIGNWILGVLGAIITTVAIHYLTDIKVLDALIKLLNALISQPVKVYVHEHSNVRKEPSTNSEIICLAPESQKIRVYGRSEEEEDWYITDYCDKGKGFIRHDLIKFSSKIDISTDSNVRETSSVKSKIVCTVRKNNKIEIYNHPEKDSENKDWYPTFYCGRLGWIRNPG